MNNTFGSIRTVGQYRAQLGETPVWCARSQSLLWVDILQQRLLRYWPDQDERIDVHPLPPFTSAVLLTSQAETFLAVSQQGITLYDYACQRFSDPLCPYPADASGTRPNEAAIAPDGSLWFSTMHPAAEKPIGSWYRFAIGDTTPRPLIGEQLVPNTLHWYDGKVWFADSLRHRFYCAEDEVTSLLELTTHDVDGLPDGSALSVSGQLLNARWGQSRLVRYQLSGRQMTELGHLPLPVVQPSSCTFGGPTLSDLYITSARDGLLQPTGMDGALLTMTTTLTGQPAGLFNLLKL